ncbi:hypothetical protein [Rhodopirellula sp. SWK7]|uniref:hypothetical protein n=1 Tax=Rhodopirellula sp. SWK7 TaxID=595460 RepID=UPI001360B0A8|nr:hypothetical protein [Rhodopirellula sp. SWK7]
MRDRSHHSSDDSAVTLAFFAQFDRMKSQRLESRVLPQPTSRLRSTPDLGNNLGLLLRGELTELPIHPNSLSHCYAASIPLSQPRRTPRLSPVPPR